jgi:hypothetical protein
MSPNFRSEEACTACGIYGENAICYHHIYSRKAFPEYTNAKFNKMPLCLKHHNEVHSSGLRSFAVKYPAVRLFLEVNGYEFNDFLGKWTHTKE